MRECVHTEVVDMAFLNIWSFYAMSQLENIWTSYRFLLENIETVNINELYWF